MSCYVLNICESSFFRLLAFDFVKQGRQWWELSKDMTSMTWIVYVCLKYFVICTFFNERYHLFFFAWFNNYIIGFLSFSFFFFEDLSSHDEWTTHTHTDCAPFLANLFLYAFEYKWLLKKFEDKDFDTLNKFKHCFRYIDDLLCLNNDELMENVMTDIYPKELALTSDHADFQSHYLDLDHDQGRQVPYKDFWQKRCI